MTFKILSRKANYTTSAVIKELKKSFGINTSEALSWLRNIENPLFPESSDQLKYAIEDFYNIEILTDNRVECYRSYRSYQEVSKEDSDKAREWVNGLSDDDKNCLEIYMRENRSYPACG